jgi:chromosomal replication initiator protein
VGEQSFTTWFEPIVPIQLHDNVLTIQVPSQFFYEWLEEHYITLLREVIQKELGVQGRLEYSIIVDKGNESNKPYTINVSTSKTAGNSLVEKPLRNPFELKAINKINFDSQLNKNYTFDNFIEGDCNRLARSAGVAVANKPGITSFNPLMVYGGVGLGKTHLIQAIGNKVEEDCPDKYVLYVTSENFVNQFIESLKNNRIDDFRNYYLQIDVLLIDDIQFLAGKEKTQEIFFHIFNYSHQDQAFQLQQDP